MASQNSGVPKAVEAISPEPQDIVSARAKWENSFILRI
jgi:hypothetical protein